jgi:hypothetical protein
MEDQKDKLLLQMALKVNELSTYNFIKIIVNLLLILEVVMGFMSYIKYDMYYFIFIIFFLLSNYHLEKKYNVALQEYDDLKEEYLIRFKDEDI